MEILELVFTAFVTGLISVVTAIVILWLQRRENRRRTQGKRKGFLI